MRGQKFKDMALEKNNLSKINIYLKTEQQR
jgi:hypothetical protein